MPNGTFTEWRAQHKVTLTLSRENDSRIEATAFGRGLLTEVRGATMRETIGQWEGKTEYGVQIEVVSDSPGDCREEASKIADRALNHGCEAIQWESQDGEHYVCREYRKA